MTDEQILQTAREVGWNTEHKASNDYLIKFARALMAGKAEPQTTHWQGCEEVHPECRTAPTPRKPLTEEEIWALYYALPSDDFERSDRIDFARAIEKAHGIGEQT